MMEIPGSGSLIILVWFFLSACLISCFSSCSSSWKIVVEFYLFIFFFFYNWDIISRTRFSFFLSNNVIPRRDNFFDEFLVLLIRKFVSFCIILIYVIKPYLFSWKIYKLTR